MLYLWRLIYRVEVTGMKHIKILGITGGVGAGKSTILSYLAQQYGARVIELDKAAHLCMQPGTSCYEQIVDRFGKKILKEDGSIDRPVLSRIVFADRQEVEALNHMVHPAVKAYIRKEIQKERESGKVPFVVLEAALLLEDHYDEICDEIWYVYVEEETRIRRLQSSRGYTPEKTRAVLKNQKSDEEFRRFCQFMIDNSSDNVENTYKQIDRGLMIHGFL